jgi:hypothetical protein
MTRADRILIAALALLAIALWPLTAATAAGSGDRVTITGPEGETVISLGDDATYRVEGALGTVVVQVEDGAVRVTEASCPDQICVRTGAVSRPGSVIACVPNRVVVRVGGAAADGLDARIR